MCPQQTSLSSPHICQPLLCTLRFASNNIACIRPQIDQSTRAAFWRNTLTIWVVSNRHRPSPSADRTSTTSSSCQSPTGPSLFPDIGPSRNPSETALTPRLAAKNNHSIYSFPIAFTKQVELWLKSYRTHSFQHPILLAQFLTIIR